MFNTITQFFTDWNDACVYAAECGLGGMPGNEYIGNGEPFTGLGFIFGICYLVYLYNERNIQLRNNERN